MCTKKLLAAIVLAGLSGSAMAASFSSPVTATNDIVFAAPVQPVTITMSPKLDNVAGNASANKELGSFSVKSTAAQRLGVRFTPSAGTPTAGNPLEMTFKGKANAANILKLGVTSTAVRTNQTVGTDTYSVLNAAGTTIDGKIIASGAQKIVADTYPVSMDAVIYTP